MILAAHNGLAVMAHETSILLKLPVQIDDLEVRVNRAYAAWPDRLQVVDAKGKLAYVGKPGPRGFSVGDLPPVLERLLKQ